MEPITWWFPVVGRVSYRSYFDPELADRFAADLADRGYDTYTRTAALYSTLGWFDDPVPRALLSWPRFDLVYVIVHELVHETIYVAGDVDYNEALATFIGHHATLAFFADDAEQQAAARRSFADDLEFAALLAELSTELRDLYARANGAEDARRRRAEVFGRYQTERFSERRWLTRRYSGFPELELNNAFLLANQTYMRDLPCFERELEQAGDLRGFIARQREAPGRHDAACAPAAADGGR